MFRTPLNQNLLDGTDRGREFLLRTPMKRFGKLEELAGAAVFLVLRGRQLRHRRGAGRRRRVPGQRGESVVTAVPDEDGGHYRWVICALLFFATTINYVDRGVVGILKTTLQGEFGWNEIDYSNIVFAFQSAYAIGLMLAGRLMDKVGTKAGYAIALIVWSLAAVACAEATTFGPAAASLLATVGFVDHAIGGRVHGGAVCAGTGRGRQLPGGDQERRRVVPQEANARWRPASSTPAPTSAPS